MRLLFKTVSLIKSRERVLEIRGLEIRGLKIRGLKGSVMLSKLSAML